MLPKRGGTPLAQARKLAIEKAAEEKNIITKARRAPRNVRDQGGFGSCAAHAFAGAVTAALRNKYGIEVDEDAIVNPLLASCKGAWDGMHVDKLARKWNADASMLPDIDKKKRIVFTVELERYDTLSDAYKAFDDVRGFVAVIKTAKRGHKTHAVTLESRWPGSETDLHGKNSWGADKPILRIASTNFEHALMISPKITEITDWKVLPLRDVPPAATDSQYC